MKDLFDATKGLLDAIPDIEKKKLVQEDWLIFLNSINEKTGYKPDVDGEESKNHALKNILIQRNESLVVLEQESFFCNTGKMDMLRAKGEIQNLDFLEDQRKRVCAEVEFGYKETLMDNMSLKFRNINALGQISAVPSWSLDKARGPVDLVGPEKPRNGDGSVNDNWAKNLRGKAKDGGMMPPAKGKKADKKKIPPKPPKFDNFLEENKKIHRDHLAAEKERIQAQFESFPLAQRKPKFEQFDEVFVEKISFADDINTKVMKLLHCFRGKGSSKDDFCGLVMKMLMIGDVTNETYNRLYENDKKVLDGLRANIDRIYEKFYETASYQK
jgi:hypothetical protein